MEAAKLLTEFEKEDFRILMAIEIGMKRSEYVPIKDIRFYARYPIEETMYRLNRVHKQDLIIRNSAEYEVSYTLNSIGYDVLALHALVEKDIISQLGPMLGKGKESDVYSCKDDEENIFALKIYRMGRTSFKKIKLLRSLIGERSHISWLYVNRLAAKREYEALKEIYELGLDTPKPIGINRHILVMEYLQGKELVYYKEIDDPLYLFNQIIGQYRKIYRKKKMIHGDLGEFNIIVDEEGNILIIDWLQWIPADHPNSSFYLHRDLSNLCNYFTKKFNLICDVEEILAKFLE